VRAGKGGNEKVTKWLQFVAIIKNALFVDSGGLPAAHSCVLNV
jgi:hypothetical protein